MNKYILYIACVFLQLGFVACKQRPSPSNPLVKSTSIKLHPGATFSDTLVIHQFPVVVFYNPDSAQLVQIKKMTKESIIESQAHQFYFQMRNARIVMKRDWPKYTCIETHHARYLQFQNQAHQQQLVDLNSYEDFSGMILWDGTKKPHQIDMMNVETELSYYFKMP
jgi:hypothetical protein